MGGDEAFYKGIIFLKEVLEKELTEIQNRSGQKVLLGLFSGLVKEVREEEGEEY